jgi:hypothetical protein
MALVRGPGRQRGIGQHLAAFNQSTRQPDTSIANEGGWRESGHLLEVADDLKTGDVRRAGESREFEAADGIALDISRYAAIRRVESTWVCARAQSHSRQPTA